MTFGLILAVSFPAAADFNTVDLAHEIALSEFQMPATSNGKLSFRECDGCVIQTYRVTNDTQYVLNRSSLELTEFRKQLLKIRNRNEEMVIVKRNLESDTIVSVSVSL
jgi:hypothetical protein